MLIICCFVSILNIQISYLHVKQKKLDLQRFQTLMFIGKIINSKHQCIVNQHFLEFIPTIDPLLQQSIKVVQLLLRFTITTVSKKTLRLVLPYLGTQSLRLKKKLNKLLKEQLKSGKLEIVLKTTKRMSLCFRFKDAISRYLLSGVIYEYKCLMCISRYIGSTYSYWQKILEEHLYMSALAGKPL